MKYCPKCDKSDFEFNNFCDNCGDELQPSIKCTCGYQFSRVQKFCPKCGNSKPGVSK